MLLPKVTVCVTNGDVSKIRYSEDIRTRVTPSTRRAFKRIAKARNLDESDIQREAFTQYLNSPPAKQVLESEQPKANAA